MKRLLATVKHVIPINNVFAYGADCEVCSNRVATYECGPQCILRDAPGPGYVYKECEGWVKNE